MSARAWGLLSGWGLAVLAGLYLVAGHRFDTGSGGSPRRTWPGDWGPPCPILFVHPYCPCTPASLRNFEALLAETGSEGIVVVAHADPLATPNGQSASRVARCAVRPDPDGAIARQFGAETSGHLFVYSRGGHLSFTGGITDGRGREGDCPARRAAAGCVSGNSTEYQSWPVFGCALYQEGNP